MKSADVIDTAAGLAAGDRLYSARRFRAKVVDASQASHDSIMLHPVEGLSVSDRLRVAVAVCESDGAAALTEHYRSLLRASAEVPLLESATSAAALQFAVALTTDPRRGDQRAIEALRSAGLADAAIVALAQLVAFLSYQTRVVAGLRAMSAEASSAPIASVPGESQRAASPAKNPASSAPTIRRNGFTNEALDWRSWLAPIELSQASELQLAVLDESQAQARTSQYYQTLVHQPLMLRHRSEAYNAILYAPGGLPRAERELGAMVVSVTNGCVYCTSVHAQRFEQLTKRHDTIEQVFDNPATAGTTDRERAIARFGQAVTLRPQSLSPADIAPLRDLGMGHEDIIDLLHATAIFGWANRLMQNLGEPVLPAS